MSNRTLVELNHDYCPRGGDDLTEWALAMQRYMHSGDKSDLPRGVTFKHLRHYMSADPLEGYGDPS